MNCPLQKIILPRLSQTVLYYNTKSLYKKDPPLFLPVDQQGQEQSGLQHRVLVSFFRSKVFP